MHDSAKFHTRSIGNIQIYLESRSLAPKKIKKYSIQRTFSRNVSSLDSKVKCTHVSLVAALWPCAFSFCDSILTRSTNKTRAWENVKGRSPLGISILLLFVETSECYDMLPVNRRRSKNNVLAYVDCTLWSVVDIVVLRGETSRKQTTQREPKKCICTRISDVLFSHTHTQKR